MFYGGCRGRLLHLLHRDQEIIAVFDRSDLLSVAVERIDVLRVAVELLAHLRQALEDERTLGDSRGTDAFARPVVCAAVRGENCVARRDEIVLDLEDDVVASEFVQSVDYFG